MNTNKLLAHQKGFTLIELMVVLTVLGVMVAFAVPNFREARRNAGLTDTANTLVSSVYRARSEAMKEGVTAVLAPGNANGPSGDDWAQGWVIYLDRNLSDAYDAGDEIVAVQQGTDIPSDYVTVSGNPVKFRGNGFPQVTAGSTGNLTLNIARTDKDGDRYIRRVIISTSGRVRSCRPDVDTNNCSAGSSGGGGGGGGGG